MSPKIHVLGAVPRSAPALTGETILQSLLEAGVPFPHNCQSGNCGACKCELIEGDVLELPYSEYALSDAERAQNRILACRTQVWGDTTIQMLDAEEFVVHPSRVMRCRLVELEDLTHDIKRLKLEILQGGPYTFSAGQHARLKFAPGIPERSYSMASLPTEETLEFHVRQVPRGQASGYVFMSLHAGAEITVSGPLGNAYLRESHSGPILAIAGGSGMAPIKSIVETALAADTNREIHMYFGVRDDRDVYLEPHLVGLTKRYPNFSLDIVLSAPGRETGRRRGMIADAVKADVSSFDGFKAYVAGPPPMVEAVQNRLLEGGMALRDVHADAFYSQADDAFSVG